MAQFSSVQSLSHVWLFATPWTAAACQASLSNTNSRSLLKLMSIESVMTSSHLILCRPCLLLPSNFPSVRVFSNELPEYGELQLQHQSFQWILRTDFLKAGLFGSSFSPRDPQESSPIHTSKVSILQSLAFFIVQLSHPYMTTGKTIALTRQTFVSKVMSLFNMLSRLVIVFLPRSKHLLISWLESPTAVVLESKEIKFVTICTVSHLFTMKWWDWMPWS